MACWGLGASPWPTGRLMSMLENTLFPWTCATTQLKHIFLLLDGYIVILVWWSTCSQQSQRVLSVAMRAEAGIGILGLHLSHQGFVNVLFVPWTYSIFHVKVIQNASQCLLENKRKKTQKTQTKLKTEKKKPKTQPKMSCSCWGCWCFGTAV